MKFWPIYMHVMRHTVADTYSREELPAESVNSSGKKVVLPIYERAENHKHPKPNLGTVVWIWRKIILSVAKNLKNVSDY